MRIIRDLAEYPAGKSAVAIGKFDGVHRGHQELLATLKGIADKRHLTAAVFTFDPSPAVLFGRQEEPLMSAEEKREAFRELGVDVLVEYPFDRERAAMKPETFVEKILVEGMHAAAIVCGEDVSFGAGGRGDRILLAALGERYGFDVTVVDKVLADGSPISSSRIRQALKEGHSEEALRMLGRKSG